MKNRIYRFIIAGFILLSFLLVLFALPAPTQAQATRMPKDCHVCETVFLENTPTATAIACGSFCKEREAETPVPTLAPTAIACGSFCKEREDETPVPAPAGKPGQVEYEAGVVKVLFFWTERCPQCLEVKAFSLPNLEKEYGQKLLIHQVELQSEDQAAPLLKMAASSETSGSQAGLPLLFIGENILVGSKTISEDLPGLVKSYLAGGGIGYPDLPELESYLPSAGSALATDSGRQSGSLPHLGTGSTGVWITFFWGDGCPHCEEAKPFLQELAEAYPQIELRMYEVWFDLENQDFFTEMAAVYGFEPHAVPTIFIGTQYWEGYNDLVRAEIQSVVQTCLAEGCPPAGASVSAGDAGEDASLLIAGIDAGAGQTGGRSINIPLLGSIDLSSQSLLVSTLLISFIDGFNPCSIWVLTMLLALTLHTGSRKKVLLIGLIFLTVTAAVYGLFIAGLFTMFKVVSFVGWIQAVVVLAALFFALVNIKDYFWYKEGVSFTISDDKKPGIFKRIRRIMDAGQSFWGLVGGTIVLAGGVSLVEFSCTAGFPVLWTNLLVSQDVTALTFVLLLLVYLLIYQLDEMGIFFFAVLTMRASKMEEKHGRILKLVGGMLMLTLALVMLVNPNLMNDLSSSLVIFGAAFGATIFVLLVHRIILPKLGIRIGTELND